MARTRAKRRRNQALVTIALVLSVLVIAFAHDVSRSAHGARSPRRSENRSFGALTNRLVGEQNAFDARLAYLLGHGASLSRAVVLARLDQLAQQLPGWQTDASLLRRPTIAHQLNTVTAQLFEQRIDDDATLLDTIAGALRLPWTPLVTPSQSFSAAQASLANTTAAWSLARWGLVREPGLVRLAPLSDAMATVPLRSALANLSAAPTLTLVRGIGITAVAVTPSPLPAPPGQLVLPPTTTVHLAVTVSNAAVDVQPVTLTIVATPTGALGVAQRQVMSVTLGPLDSYGFVANDLATVASEHFTLTLSVAGAPGARRWSTTRTYHVTMAPSGAG